MKELFFLLPALVQTGSDGITVSNGVAYHKNDYYDKSYTLSGNYNDRPVFEYSRPNGIKATIKWNELPEDGPGLAQMAWMVMGTSTIRFVSFSDVDDPLLAKNWMYRNTNTMLIDAPEFALINGTSENTEEYFKEYDSEDKPFFTIPYYGPIPISVTVGLAAVFSLLFIIFMIYWYCTGYDKMMARKHLYEKLLAEYETKDEVFHEAKKTSIRV